MYNLTDNYESFVTNIIQNLRNEENLSNYKLDNLFLNLLNELKRLNSKENNNSTVLYTIYKYYKATQEGQEEITHISRRTQPEESKN